MCAARLVHLFSNRLRVWIFAGDPRGRVKLDVWPGRPQVGFPKLRQSRAGDSQPCLCAFGSRGAVRPAQQWARELPIRAGQ